MAKTVLGGERRRGVGVKRDGRVRMLEAKRTEETGLVFSDLVSESTSQ